MIYLERIRDIKSVPNKQKEVKESLLFYLSKYKQVEDLSNELTEQAISEFDRIVYDPLNNFVELKKSNEHLIIKADSELELEAFYYRLREKFRKETKVVGLKK